MVQQESEKTSTLSREREEEGRGEESLDPAKNTFKKEELTVS